MNLKHLSLVPALLLATSLVSPAKDVADGAVVAKTYVLATKGYIPPVGSVIDSSRVMSMKGAKMQLNIQGQMMEGAMTTNENEVEKYEVLAADKIRYTLTKAISEQKVVLMDQPMPVPAQPKPLVGKSAIFTKKDGAWSGKIAEGEASAEEKTKIEEVAKNLNLDSYFKVYGDEPRKIGDEWEVGAADVLGDDEFEGKIKMKFTKVEMFEGTECAVFESELDIDGTPEEMEGATLKMTGKLTIHRSLVDQMDLSIKMDGSMSIIGKMEPQPGMLLDMKVKGAMTMVQTNKLTKGK